MLRHNFLSVIESTNRDKVYFAEATNAFTKYTFFMPMHISVNKKNTGEKTGVCN